MNGFLNGRIEYRRFLGEDEGYEASYDSYTLEDVLVREIFTVEPDMQKEAGVTVYYFTGRSRCYDKNGEPCKFPMAHYGDICVLRAGEADEVVARVNEVGYFNGGADTGHIRLKLK